MARPPTTTDAFTAIAEPRRRQLLGLLASDEGTGAERAGERGGDRDVTWLVEKLGWPQPQVSKHLGVLRKVGLVHVARRGKRRMYSLNADQLRPVHDWVKMFERFWDHQLHRIKARAEQLEQQSKRKQPPENRADPRSH